MFNYKLLFRGDYKNAIVRKIDEKVGYIYFKVPSRGLVVMGDVPCYFRNSEISLYDYKKNIENFFSEIESYPILCVFEDQKTDIQFTLKIRAQRINNSSIIFRYDNTNTCKGYNSSNIPKNLSSGSFLIYGYSNINQNCLELERDTCSPCFYPSTKNYT